MKPVRRYQSQLLFRKAYKPARRQRFRPRGGLRPAAVTIKPWRASDYALDIQRAVAA
jgi:hypothetical protein